MHVKRFHAQNVHTLQVCKYDAIQDNLVARLGKTTRNHYRKSLTNEKKMHTTQEIIHHYETSKQAKTKSFSFTSNKFTKQYIKLMMMNSTTNK